MSEKFLYTTCSHCGLVKIRAFDKDLPYSNISSCSRGVINAQCSGKLLFFPVPVLTNFWSPRIFFVKTQRIRNKPSNFTKFFKLSIIYFTQKRQSKSAKKIFRACLSKSCSTFHVNLISMNMQQKKLANEVTW